MAEKRVECWYTGWVNSGDASHDELAMKALVAEFRAHAHAALEKAARAICPFCADGKPLIPNPQFGWLHQYPDDPKSTSYCFAAAIHSLKEATEQER